MLERSNCFKYKLLSEHNLRLVVESNSINAIGLEIAMLCSFVNFSIMYLIIFMTSFQVQTIPSRKLK